MEERSEPAGAPALRDGHYSVAHGEHTLHYQVVNGVPLFEGDIVLHTTALPAGSTSLRPLIMRDGDKWRWPRGIIPYTVDPRLADDVKTRIANAVQHWAAHTSIRFVPRTDANAGLFPDYVTFQPGDASNSKIGRVGGQQFINLATDDDGNRTIRHEMGHAVGMIHTHTRPDRDSFVTIMFDNIKDDPYDRSQFAILAFANGNVEITPYDYGSLLHYGAYSRSIDPKTKPTIVPLGGQTIGQTNSLSALDIANVVATYPAPVRTFSEFVTGFAAGGRVLGAILNGQCYTNAFGTWGWVSGSDKNRNVARMAINVSGTYEPTPVFYWVTDAGLAYFCKIPYEPQPLAPPANHVFADISDAPTGIWATTTDGSIWQGASVRVPGPPNCKALCITVAPDKTGKAVYITTDEPGANVYAYVAATGGWTRLGTLHANDVGAGGDGSVWAVNGHGLFRWVIDGWLKVDSAAKTTVAVTFDGSPLTSDAQGKGYLYAPQPYSPWWKMPASNVVDMAVRRNGHLHAIDSVNGLVAWNGSQWTAEGGGASVTSGAIAADQINSGSLAMFAVSGTSVYYKGAGMTDWLNVGAGFVTLVDVAVLSADSAYICTNDAIFVVTAQPFGIVIWLTGVPGGIKRISAGKDGNIWRIDNAGNVWELVAGTWQGRGSPKAVDICCIGGTQGGAWIVTQSGTLARWNGNGWTLGVDLAGVQSLGVSPVHAGLVWVVGTDGCVYQRVN